MTYPNHSLIITHLMCTLFLLDIINVHLPAQKHMVEDDILFTNYLAGKWEIPALVLTSVSYLGGN